jgi:hypothetical protein
LRDFVAFFAIFEKSLIKIAPPGLLEPLERDVEELSKLFQAYSGCEIKLREWDFSDPSPEQVKVLHDADRTNAESLWSMIVNYGTYAVVVVNDMKRPNGDRLVNTCYRRFLAIKEIYHVVMRDEFGRLGLNHPNNNTPERLATAIDQLSFLNFTMVDFDSPQYPDSTKIENAAELFAILTLYPLEDMAADRALFVGGNLGSTDDPNVIASSTLDLAERRRVPRHYVDVLFRWHRFDELLLLYKQLRDGY